MQTSTPKTIWITGASSGIGKACAQVYANNGYRIILSSRRKDALEDVKADLIKGHGVNSYNIFIQTLDLSDSCNFNSITSDLLKQAGTIDIRSMLEELVNVHLLLKHLLM